MNTLSVWRFPTPDGAEEALAELVRLVGRGAGRASTTRR